MLAKKFHLPIQKFARQKSQSLSGGYFTFKKAANNLPHSRFGIIISGKAEKKAVRRNKIKRIFFNFARSKKLHQISGLDFLLIARPQSFAAGKKEIEAELSKFLSSV